MTSFAWSLPRFRSPPIVSVAAVLFMASVAILLQAYVLVKLAFLLLFLVAALVDVAVRQRMMVFPRLLVFYLVTAVAGIIWAIVGLFHPGNYLVGVFEALRLYAIWSLAFAVLYTLLRNRSSLPLIHIAMVVAGIGISLINLVGLADTAGGWGLISESFRHELDLGVGIGDGTIQITSQNIGALFVIAPYLLALHLRADSEIPHPWVSKLSLILSLITVAVSGRRALWLVVAFSPALILLVSTLTGGYGRLKVAGRRLLLLAAAAAALGLVLLSTLPEMPTTTTVGRLQAALSAQDERSIQGPYLIAGFKEAPILGSGLGAYAGYVRSEDRPWNYELTYQKMLFNLGILGTLLLAVLFTYYVWLVIRLLQRNAAGSAIPFGLLVAFLSLLMGAYSNPYFGSFDYLFFVGLLPYLSTFRRGFTEPQVAGEGAR